MEESGRLNASRGRAGEGSTERHVSRSCNAKQEVLVNTIELTSRYYSLVSNSLQRGVIVKSKIASMNDMISVGLFGEFVERFQVS